jgi:hypothetical protein
VVNIKPLAACRKFADLNGQPEPPYTFASIGETMSFKTLEEIFAEYEPYSFSDGFGYYVYDKAGDSIACHPHYVTNRYNQQHFEYPNINKSIFDISKKFTERRVNFLLLYDFCLFRAVYPFTPAFLRYLTSELCATDDSKYFQHLIKTETYIYLIKDRDTGYTKIGRSINPKQRLKALIKQDTLMPKPNDFYLIDRWKDSEQTELLLHKEFAAKRRRGEWFDLSDQDLGKIQNFVDCRQDKAEWKYE